VLSCTHNLKVIMQVHARVCPQTHSTPIPDRACNGKPNNNTTTNNNYYKSSNTSNTNTTTNNYYKSSNNSNSHPETINIDGGAG
jgi:hypothetical protein